MEFQPDHDVEDVTVRNLRVGFLSDKKMTEAVRDVSFTLRRGKITALAGESGSGKSVTALTIMNLLPSKARILGGSILWKGEDLLKLPEKERQKLNGTTFGMIFQDPSGALDPLFSIGDQMTEGILAHQKCSREEARERAISCLRATNLPRPEQLMKLRPFELSGGMCQRVTIAMAMSLKPSFLIADEPTTALDVTVQKQILGEILRACRDQNIGVLFITHDLGVVAELADDVSVMQGGRIVEQGDVYRVFEHPRHPYTRKLLDAVL